MPGDEISKENTKNKLNINEDKQSKNKQKEKSKKIMKTKVGEKI